MNTRKLVEEDRHAVDLLLDSGTAEGQAMTRSTRVVTPDRLAAAKQVLAMIGEMPEVDLPRNLLARTLARIDESTAAPAPLPAAVRATMHLRPS